jgi:hypothetical protein
MTNEHREQEFAIKLYRRRVEYRQKDLEGLHVSVGKSDCVQE